MIAHGKEVYERHCIGCHGVKGDGNGPAATFTHVQRPRNFTYGVFKFRLTKGPLPSDADLLRTITRGVRGTAMPAWFELPLRGSPRRDPVRQVRADGRPLRPDQPYFYFVDEPPGPPLADRPAAAAHGRRWSRTAARSGSRPSAGNATAEPARATARRRPG